MGHDCCKGHTHEHDCCCENGQHEQAHDCCCELLENQEKEATACCHDHSHAHHNGECCHAHHSHAHHDGECCHDHSHAHHDCCGGHHHHHDHAHHHHHDHSGCGCGHHHGDEDYDVNQGLTVQFSGQFDASIEEVWNMLTQNDNVQQWFPELEFVKLEAGGTLRFNGKDGYTEEMMVLDVEPPHYLSFTWDINTITFELHDISQDKTALLFTEWLSEINDHSPKDLTGWMICLQNIASLLEGKPLEDREEKFHEIYPKIKEMLEQQASTEFSD